MGRRAIITLTLNPALDLSSTVADVAPTHKLRCSTPVAEPGGGGVNVSRVCARLGEPTSAIVALGGPPGRKVADLLESEGLDVHAINVQAETRQSLSVFETSTGEQYRFVFPGPEVQPDDVQRCCDEVSVLASEASCLVISGSMPPGIDGGIVGSIVATLPNVPVIVDTAGPALRVALQSGCFLAKPSVGELSRVVGRELKTEQDIAAAADEVMATAKLEHLVISLGPMGSLVVSADGSRHRLHAPEVQAISAIGAGDSMVAGLAVGIHRSLPFGETLALGVASGTAAVLTEGSTLCEPQAVAELLSIVLDQNGNGAVT